MKTFQQIENILSDNIETPIPHIRLTHVPPWNENQKLRSGRAVIEPDLTNLSFIGTTETTNDYNTNNNGINAIQMTIKQTDMINHLLTFTSNITSQINVGRIDERGSGNEVTTVSTTAAGTAAASIQFNNVENDYGFSQYERMGWQKLMLISAFCLLIIITVIGNTLVILSVITTRRLRTVTNCFVMSLAVADWLVGIFVMPPAVVLFVVGKFPIFYSSFLRLIILFFCLNFLLIRKYFITL